MSNSQTLYSYRDYGPNVLVREFAQLTKMAVYRDGALAAPTAVGSSYKLIDPNGDEVTLTDATVSVVDDIAQVSILAADLPDTLGLGEGYLEEWTLLHADGTTRMKRREAAVARHAFYPVITDVDLTAEYPDLDRWQGSTLTSWQSQIDSAWKRMINMLRTTGHFPYLIMSPTAFREAHIELTLHLIFRWFLMKQGGDRWTKLADDHLTQFRDAWARINFVIDEDHDGLPESTDRTAASRVVHLNARPRRRTSRSPKW